MRVDVGDVELHVREEGSGRPLVLLHGGPGLDGSVFWPEIAPLAAEGWRLLAVDHRGNGRSDAGDSARWTVAQMADDVEQLLIELELRNAVVLGWSFGSFIAQQHLVAHGTADAYVLMGTVAEAGALHAVGERLAAFEPEYLRQQVTASWDREASVTTQPECVQLTRDQTPFHVADPEGPLVAVLQARADGIVHQPAVLRHFAAGGDYGLADHREALRSCTRPVLILSGEHDRTTPAASAHELVGILPHGEEAVIADAAHMMLDEQPEATLAALRDFLSRV